MKRPGVCFSSEISIATIWGSFLPAFFSFKNLKTAQTMQSYSVIDQKVLLVRCSFVETTTKEWYKRLFFSPHQVLCESRSLGSALSSSRKSSFPKRYWSREFKLWQKATKLVSVKRRLSLVRHSCENLAKRSFSSFSLSWNFSHTDNSSLADSRILPSRTT